jgi:hypothetical protein
MARADSAQTCLDNVSARQRRTKATEARVFVVQPQTKSMERRAAHADERERGDRIPERARVRRRAADARAGAAAAAAARAGRRVRPPRRPRPPPPPRPPGRRRRPRRRRRGGGRARRRARCPCRTTPPATGRRARTRWSRCTPGPRPAAAPAQTNLVQTALVARVTADDLCTDANMGSERLVSGQPQLLPGSGRFRPRQSPGSEQATREPMRAWAD